VLDTFKTKYLCEPFISEKARYFQKIAEEYYAKAEEYDRLVCTGSAANDRVLPANGYELQLISKNARLLIKELANYYGVEKFEVYNAINEFYRRYR
jgi:hypothetical protein